MIDIFLFVFFIFLFYILHVPGAGTEYLVCSEELAIYEIFVDFRLQYFLSPSKVSMSLSVSQYKYTNARLSMWHLTDSSATRYIFRGFEPLILKGIQQCFRPASQFPRQFKHTAMVVGPFVQEFTHPHCRSCRNRHRCSTFLPRFRKQRV